MEFKSSLEKYLELNRKVNKGRSLMIHLGRKNQINKHEVVNNWVGSTTSEKDLHIIAEHKLNASANYSKNGKSHPGVLVICRTWGFTFLSVSLSLVLDYSIWFWMPLLERHR